jgi:NTP pyrophosphatase (non-canonical NTP hydrolase)
MDTNTTLDDLKGAVNKFVADRDWEKYHTSKNLAMSIAIEAAELMELFQWRSGEAGQELLQDPENKAQIGEELADILIYCLGFANQADLDISELVLAKLKKNETRFPPGMPLSYELDLTG